MRILWTGDEALPACAGERVDEVRRCALSNCALAEAITLAEPGESSVLCLVEFEKSRPCVAALDYLNRHHPLVPIGLVARLEQRPEAYELLRNRMVDRVMPRESLEFDLELHLNALAEHGQRLSTLSRHLRTLENTTLFVTGATGFLGCHFLRYLLRCSGARVVALTRSTHDVAHHARLAHLERIYPGRIRCVEGDIGQPDLGINAGARAALPEVDTLWHFAADTRFEPLLRDELFRVNLEGTRNVLQFARSLPSLSHFYHVSTAYVVGDQRAGTIVPEARLAHPASFKNPYEESKYLAECAVAESGLPVTIFRPSIILGERVSGLCDGQTVYKVAQLIRLARLSGRRSTAPGSDTFRVVVDPETTKNLIPADDVIVQMLQIAALKSAPGSYHHLTHPEPTLMSDLVAVIANLLDIPEYEAVLSLEGESLSPSEALLQRISGVFKPYMLNSDPVFARDASLSSLTAAVDRDSLAYLLRSFFEQHYGWEFQPAAASV